MKSKLRLFSIFTLLLAFPLAAGASVETVDSENFGDVELGSTAEAIITIQNTDFLFPAIIDSVALDPSAGVFVIIANPTGMELLPGESADVAVTFTPSALGDASVKLYIGWTNSGPGTAEVVLTGTGVDSSSDPVSVQEILDFFDQSVADGTLVGDGPGSSADGRRGALRNKIKAAGDTLEDGGDACEQLLDAYQRCDGLPRPPEFVAGSATQTLAEMILVLMGDLGCE